MLPRQIAARTAKGSARAPRIALPPWNDRRLLLASSRPPYVPRSFGLRGAQPAHYISPAGRITESRLSTSRNADLVLALKDGQIIERGTHEELLQARGFSYDLSRSQFRRDGDFAEEVAAPVAAIGR